RPSRLQTAPRPPHLGPISRTDPNEPRRDGEQPSTQRRRCRGRSRRKKPWKPTVRHELPAARSPPFLNQISRVRYQEPDRILKGDLRGIEAVEVRGIHHRANHSFCAKGGSAEFSAEV
ncbi:hypothetical protein Prudu_86S000200, partial [Prunus dulcis]